MGVEVSISGMACCSHVLELSCCGSARTPDRQSMLRRCLWLEEAPESELSTSWLNRFRTEGECDCCLHGHHASISYMGLGHTRVLDKGSAIEPVEHVRHYCLWRDYPQFTNAKTYSPRGKSFSVRGDLVRRSKVDRTRGRNCSLINVLLRA